MYHGDETRQTYCSFVLQEFRSQSPGPQGLQLLGQAERPGPIRAGLGQGFAGYIISLFALPADEETGFKGGDDELKVTGWILAETQPPESKSSSPAKPEGLHVGRLLSPRHTTGAGQPAPWAENMEDY